MDVRELTTADLSDVLSLYSDSHPEYNALGSAKVAAVWRSIIDDPHQFYFGVFLQDQLVASCALIVVPNLIDNGCPLGMIENVITHKQYRRQGLGRRVLLAALNHAWSKDCHKVMLLSGRFDKGMAQFYQSVGFDPSQNQAFVARPQSLSEAV